MTKTNIKTTVSACIAIILVMCVLLVVGCDENGDGAATTADITTATGTTAIIPEGTTANTPGASDATTNANETTAQKRDETMADTVMTTLPTDKVDTTKTDEQTTAPETDTKNTASIATLTQYTNASKTMRETLKAIFDGMSGGLSEFLGKATGNDASYEADVKLNTESITLLNNDYLGGKPLSTGFNIKKNEQGTAVSGIVTVSGENAPYNLYIKDGGVYLRLPDVDNTKFLRISDSGELLSVLEILGSLDELPTFDVSSLFDGKLSDYIPDALANVIIRQLISSTKENATVLGKEYKALTKIELTLGADSAGGIAGMLGIQAIYYLSGETPVKAVYKIADYADITFDMVQTETQNGITTEYVISLNLPTEQTEPTDANSAKPVSAVTLSGTMTETETGIEGETALDMGGAEVDVTVDSTDENNSLSLTGLSLKYKTVKSTDGKTLTTDYIISGEMKTGGVSVKLDIPVKTVCETLADENRTKFSVTVNSNLGIMGKVVLSAQADIINKDVTPDIPVISYEDIIYPDAYEGEAKVMLDAYIEKIKTKYPWLLELLDMFISKPEEPETTVE